MIEIKLLEDTPFTQEQYKSFLYDYYVERAEYKYAEQAKWYRETNTYVIVVAIVNGKLAGQATAYQCSAFCTGRIINVSWGCDTFVLPQYRGMKLGKRLQQYLHEHTENFSSAGYTPLNGIIKRKCGANELFENSFMYYPFSNLINFAVRKQLQKIFKRNFDFGWSSSFPFYYYLNFTTIKIGMCQIEQYEDIEEEVLYFIESTLSSQYDFYVRRDRKYMLWKYVNNPTMSYKLMTIRNGKILSAVIFFTDVVKYSLSEVQLYYCKILDSIISKDSNITNKEVLIAVMQYWKSQHVRLDGIAAMFDVEYIGKVGFRRPVLSTLQGETVVHPYMSYSDQDLEQMK